MRILPRFLSITNIYNANKDIQVLCANLRKLGADEKKSDRSLKEIYDCLNFIGSIQDWSTAGININRILTNVTLLQFQLGNDQKYANRDHEIQVTLIQIIATLGKWCYENKNNIHMDKLLFNPNDLEFSTAKYSSLPEVKPYLHDQSFRQLMTDIYTNFKAHYDATTNINNYGAAGALLGSGFTLFVLLVSIGTGCPAWLLVSAPLAIGLISSHLAEHSVTRKLYPAPKDDILGGKSSYANMGPIQPGKPVDLDPTEPNDSLKARPALRKPKTPAHNNAHRSGPPSPQRMI